MDFEETHVKQVYERISEHFSATRYKSWPVVERFYGERINRTIVGLDIGCGNGKNIRYPHQTIALDICWGLLQICTNQRSMPHCLQASMTGIPLRSGSVDYCLCIASLHHLYGVERRGEAACEMLRVMSVGAVGLVFVWSWEQLEQQQQNQQQQQQNQQQTSSLSRHKIVHMKEDPQDVLVPWKTGEREELRYYHLFKQGELEGLFLEADRKGFKCSILESGYDRDNWYVIFQRN